MIKFCESLMMATSVLNLVLNDERNTYPGWVECFDNCREQGYVIYAYNLTDISIERSIYFARNRNSDDFVVYHNNKSPHFLSEAWANARYFKYNEYCEVVDYIFELLETVN